MGASVIDSIERAFHIKEGDLFAVHFNQFTLTGSHFIGFSYLHKACYNSPPTKFLIPRSHEAKLEPSRIGHPARIPGRVKNHFDADVLNA